MNRKAEHSLSTESEPGLQCGVGNARPFKGIAIDCIRNDGDFIGVDPARDQIDAQSLADRRHSVCTMERACLYQPRRPVA